MNIDTLRHQFPLLAPSNTNPQPLIYLDNAATTHKPRSVLTAMDDFYTHTNANIHRAVYKLAATATTAYETVREQVRAFLNAKKTTEIIFVSGATAAINLVAQSYGATKLRPGDEVIISTMEHHSNIVPWQLLCNQTGARLRVIKINPDGTLDLNHYETLLNKATKIVALTHVSNTLGTINPVKQLITTAHSYKIPVLIDGAQAIPHLPVDVQDLDCDFYLFSAHKMYGPTGVGVLYGKEELLKAMPPYQSGGDMIKQVSFASTTFAELPQKFEAGTPNVAGIIGLGATIKFLNTIGPSAITAHEKQLLAAATQELTAIKGLTIIGTAAAKIGVISFILDKIHPHDIATILDSEGIAVRAGHHCTMPLMDFYGIPGTTRISFGIYNTLAEVAKVSAAITKVKKIFLR